MSLETTAPPAPVNRIGLTKESYKGSASTLCKGCGHDSITGHIITACYEMGVEPDRVAKMSGIGCSSKSPAYFLGRSHGFNAVHGRMPSVATGAHLANRDLLVIGVSGDGDTSNIGVGQFIHLMRRNVNMVYIIENNGVYGLTKGQFSATADMGSKLKSGEVNVFEALDCCAMAIELGATFVARSFSGDAKQMVPLLKAAMAHRGIALLDVISPCVTFNNHEGSTKSYDYMKSADLPLHELSFVPAYEEIQIEEFPEGTVKTITLHDGSRLSLKKLAQGEYDLSDKIQALSAIQRAKEEGHVLTGLLYYHPRKDLIEVMNLPDRPLAAMGEGDLRPRREVFLKTLARFQ